MPRGEVTDLPDYRRETGQVLPRALVIMDEFQVLFSEEDRLAREAGRLLADIAKRGAAFGLHLLLATQSPGGPLAAYLRPVYEQMALRIALGCTQPSVSQAILGEGNDTATRLVRAGDAIYNDRRGEGANPVMRIAMLPTRERLALIGDIRALGGGRSTRRRPASTRTRRPLSPPGTPLTRRGPAGTAGALAGRCRRGWARPSRSSPPPPRRSSATPGPTCSSWAARNTVTACCWPRCSARRTSVSPAHVRFTIAEFTRPSSPFHGFFDPVRNLPHEVRIADRRTAADELDDLAADLEARLEGSGPVDSPGAEGVRPAGTVLPRRRDAPVARTAGRGRLRPSERDLGAPGLAG